MADPLVIPDYPDAYNQCLQIGEYWYDETTGETFTFRTMLHAVLSATNYKVMYPEISKFDIDDPKLMRVYPRFDGTYSALSAYSFLGTGQQINIVQADKPLVSYNKETKTFVVTYLGTDVSGYKYLFTYYFRRKDEELIPLNIDCIKPDLDIININFTDWSRLSAEFVPTGSEKPFFAGDLVNFENALTARYTTQSENSACQTNLISHGALSATHKTGQVQSLYVGDRADGFNTIWVGCSSVEYIQGVKYPFPVMYNTSYILPQGVYNKTSDIEFSAQIALYGPEYGLSNRAVYSKPSELPMSLTGTWSTALTSFSANNGSGLDPNFKPGNGFSIFFYDANHTPVIPYYPYTAFSYPSTSRVGLSGFYPGGVGKSLGYKPYSGYAHLTDPGPLGVSSSASQYLSCATLSAPGLESGYLGVGFDVAGGFSAWSTVSGQTGLSALSGGDSVCVTGGRWNAFKDLAITPTTLSTYTTAAATSGLGIPDTALYQRLTGTRDATLEFHTYKVSLEHCGSRVRVDIKPWLSDIFYNYIDYTLSTSELAAVASMSALKVGFAFSTSDKTATCEMRDLNVYGRYTTNAIYKTPCATSCSPALISDTSTNICPVTAQMNILETETDFSPVVTEGTIAGNYGLCYINRNIEDTLYYGTVLQGPIGSFMQSVHSTNANSVIPLSNILGKGNTPPNVGSSSY